MKCTNCQTELPVNAKFCPNCGSPAQITCPKCQTVVTPGAKFCHNCGTALQNPSAVDTAYIAAEHKEPSCQERLTELVDSARYEDLLSFCKEEITKNPDNEDIFTNLAELITSEKIANAQNFLEELQKSFPENTNIKFLFVGLFIAQEDLTHAWTITEDIMRSVDTLNKENQATLYFFRFSILINMTDQPASPSEAMKKVDTLREFLSQENQNIFDYYKGLYLVSEEKFQEAFEVADNLLRNNPDDLNIRYLHALATLNGDKEGWLADLETIWNNPNVTEELKENIKQLLDNKILLDNAFIIADSKSGVSGAGRKPSLTNIFCEANEDLKPYGIFSHRHNSEIDFILSAAQKNTHVIFTPHLLPVNRGILSTIYFKTKAGKDELENTIREKYKGRYFVRVKNTIPAIRYVANTNFIDIAVYKKDDTAIIVSAIDNLLKGASGQAVQCFNIMQNIEETTGLI